MGFIISLFFALVFFGGWKILRATSGDSGKTAVRVAGPLLGLMGGLFLLLALVRCFAVVPAGHVGVVDFFGHVNPKSLPAGIHFVNPFADIIKMSVQTQEIKEVLDVPSQEGLTMQLEISVLYNLDPASAPRVYQEVGLGFVEKILEPNIRSVVRGVTAGSEAKSLYTSEREHLAQLIFADIRKLVEPAGIIIQSTPLRKVTLPARVAAAIEEKLSADQENQRMTFTLLKEKQEAERKRIEAQGIADFQRIVTAGISDPLLRWKGIEATLKIAESANTKVVIIGSGKDGLPIILGDK